ncbi:MAG: SusD/RagB family nutrient-binding outer membrane lipoprotein [Bacteroidales bacterium]|nr:SusD/RagB family nutrient-binding outer membrane lipoprotein [Bacteroidales bacterium]
MKNILKYISLLTVALLLTSCEDYLDVNIDPNNPTSVSPDLVLPAGQYHTAYIMQHDRRINHIGNMMMYNWSQSDGYDWYSDEFKYDVTSSFYRYIFLYSYLNSLKQYQLLAQLEGDINANYRAIGMIMKAYHFQLLVDFYGDIPYSEALQRKDDATPKYDDAQEVYNDLIVQLTNAIDEIKNAEASVGPGADDAMFGGDMTQWIRFANTVKLRILVRESDVKDVSADMDAIVAEGSGFITSDVVVNPGYVKEENKQTPIWNDFGEDAGGTQTLSSKATCATDYIIEYLTSTNDPRISYIYEEPATGHLGVKQGLLDYDTPVPDAFMPELVSNIGPGILKGPGMGANIFTLAECYFLQAEAALKGDLDGVPKDLYEAGIQASFDYLGAPGAEAYYSQAVPLVGWNSSGGQELEAIITQKWIAVNGITAEQSWFDYSRTGFPSNLPISLLASTPDRPVRLYYPALEYAVNGDNVPSQPDAFTDKIFWAQ